MNRGQDDLSGLSNLQGRVAIITGAAQGMGAAIAGCLAAHGARVVVADVNEEKARLQADALTGAGGEAVAFGVDVTDETAVTEMVAFARATYADTQVLVNSAGILRRTRVEAITKSEWDLVLDVNLNGTFLCCAAVLETMRRQGHGRIINLASSAGRSVSTLGGAHYTASKAGVIGLTRALAVELGADGITVNAICPGLIDTEMVEENCAPERVQEYADSFPIKRLGTPAEVAELVRFLVADGAYITGACLDINGGDLML